MKTLTTAQAHSYIEGDRVEISTQDMRVWKRLWHWLTFRSPPILRRTYTIMSITNTTINIKERPMPSKRQQEQHRCDVYSVDNETDAAVLVTVKGQGHDYGQMWFPLSQVHEIHAHDAQPYIVVTVWIAKKKGILE